MALNLSLVQDINPGADSSFPGGFTPLLGELYFGADNGTVGDDWTLDKKSLLAYILR